MSEITEAQTGRATNFIRNIIEEDLAAGVTVVPGMELTTSEEAHVVCLFPTVEQAEAFGDYVESRSPEIRNRADGGIRRGGVSSSH